MKSYGLRSKRGAVFAKGLDYQTANSLATHLDLTVVAVEEVTFVSGCDFVKVDEKITVLDLIETGEVAK